MVLVRSARSFFPKKDRGFSAVARQRNTAHAAFRIGGKIGGVILEVGCQQDQSHTENTADNVEGKPAFRNTAVHQIAHHAVQQSHREHERDILQDAGKTALN